MTQTGDSAAGAHNPTAVQRKGDRELVITRIFDAPTSMVFQAWSRPELFQRWWVPKSLTGVALVGCEMDVRTGGTYRLEFGAGGADTMVFFGKYLEVIPNERIVWTNEEDQAGAITTVTFADHGGKTLLTFHERYPSAEALAEALATGEAALPEQLDQLRAMLSDPGATAA